MIAGQFRSRVLQAPRGMDTRPTSDKLRETLFNILGERVVGAHFLDLFAGSGAVGIEAMSRGAASCTFVESARPAVFALRDNLEALKIKAGVQVEAREVGSALERMLKSPQPFELVFLDPPYEAAEEYAAALEFLARHHAVLLAPDALVIAEHRKKSPLAERFGALERTRVKEQGDAALSFFRIREDTGNVR